MIAAKEINARKYSRLLAKALPRAIESEEERRRAHKTIEALMADKNRTVEEGELLRLLAVLVQEYEQRTFDIPEVPPHELLQFIMEEAGLKQKDLLDVFGTPSIVSAVVNGKRAISKAQALKLAERFKMSPSAFIRWKG
jgi:HTH-type transcriptional regulator/antitoxin HigA